jgi:hypothetical protein
MKQPIAPTSRPAMGTAWKRPAFRSKRPWAYQTVSGEEDLNGTALVIAFWTRGGRRRAADRECRLERSGRHGVANRSR